MEAWCKHVKSLTKSGKGKRDFRNRRAAQRSLNECKDAVPAWVMPLHRVWDTVEPAPGMFDVIIVDEASQCGFEALPLFYLGEKILIVGDDKQISPSGEFQDTAPINKLLDEYLHDFKFKEYFDVNVSLFDHGKLRYGTRRITLREHNPLKAIWSEPVAAAGACVRERWVSRRLKQQSDQPTRS
jgi:hypothetical protein